MIQNFDIFEIFPILSFSTIFSMFVYFQTFDVNLRYFCNIDTLVQVSEANKMGVVPLGRAERQNGIVASEPYGSKLGESSS